MNARTLHADYLVIGGGAAAMAFTDALLSETDDRVVMVDRRHAPGGHWNDAYPFVHLHQPSRYYGVNSMPLGNEVLQTSGPEAGMYERASAAQICGYYQRVLSERFLPSDRVRYFPQCEYVGDGTFVSRLTGRRYDVEVRKKRVDATHLSPSIPVESGPRFEVDSGVSCIPLNDLARVTDSPDDGYVIIGGGKTAIDACLWLLDNGVDPAAICWIKPREAWLFNRTYFQPGELVGRFLLGLGLQMEAAANARTTDDLFRRLEDAAQLRRVDRGVWPTMHKAATISDRELEQLRRIDNVVRLGHVRRLERRRIVLDHGSIPTGPGRLHVYCTADGLRRRPPMPVFDEDRITLQTIRPGLIPFNAALIGFVEARGGESRDKNRLCPPNPLPDTAADWMRMTLVGMNAEHAWTAEPDIAEWLDRSRLNTSAGLRRRLDDPEVARARELFTANVRRGLERLAALARVASGGA
ncbi:hypothetical protein QWY84_17410 [Aquisalimonas lutea]|uniref:hypothetical protein n=1 Tax=Aquisalimonas lutea TaxID=1327750 RepID=UPI0025B3AE3C|nr:hypothetical protein [Aquisalimonas lutea]MDN3519387.1 hypothetical protein [Aquisalimonas lutea]